MSMQELPHHYAVSARAAAEGEVTLAAPRLPDLTSAPPAEFGGPGDRWSPETLLAAAVADCFVLTFRAIAGASHLAWAALECEAAGTLDRIEGTTRFTGFTVRARLEVPPGTDPDRARRLLERAEHHCLITSSLIAPCELDAEVVVGG